MMPRGVRNCNPGNIRLNKSKFQGEVIPSQDREFKQFESMAWGYRAIFLIIHNYNILYGINTLDKIISRWAPATENHTQSYINVVAKRLGFSPTSRIDTSDEDVMEVLVASISRVENGVKANREEIREGWRLFAEGR